MNSIDIIGLVFAVVAAAIAWLRAQEKVKGYIAALTLLSIVSLTMLITVRYQVLRDLEEKLSLSSKYINDPIAMELVSDYAKAEEAVRQASSLPFFLEYFGKDRDRYQRTLQDAQNGRYVVPKNEISVFANRVIERAARNVIATSYVTSTEWWDAPWGQQYEALNYDKVKAGVNITRYFLFSSDSELAKARPLLERHVVNGVDVYVVNPKDTADTYWNDIIVVDDEFGGELLLTPEKTIRHVVMYTREGDIRRLQEVANALRVRATSAQQILQGMPGPNSPSKEDK